MNASVLAPGRVLLFGIMLHAAAPLALALPEKAHES